MSQELRISRETEFYQGYIRFKIAVTNESSSVVTDVTLDFIYDDEMLNIAKHEPDYLLKNGKIVLGNIDQGKSKTVAVYFDPLMCSKGTDINCHVAYKDHQGNLEIARMKAKEISVICPIMKTESDINIGRLKEFVANLPTKDSRIYELKSHFDVKKLVSLAREIVERHDVQHVRTLHTRDDKSFEIWYYGNTKVTKDAIIIKIFISTLDSTMELFAATKNAETLTGLLAEIGRDMKKALEANSKEGTINVTIKDSIVQRSNLLDLCNIDGTCDVNVVIEGSVVQRSNVATVNNEVTSNRLPQQSSLPKKPVDAITKKRKSESSKKSNKSKLLMPALLIVLIGGLWLGLPLLTEDSEIISSHYVEASSDTPTSITADKEYEENDDSIVDELNSEIDLESYTNSIGMEFVLIPSGDFNMGAPLEEIGRNDAEGPVHTVSIDYAFYLGTYEVTQKQWLDVMGENPSYNQGDNLPVEEVSWDDVQEFIKALNEIEGTDKYRLPSEAEWEYACRAGTTTTYYFGDNASNLGDYAWNTRNSGYDGSSLGAKPHQVGQKEPNSWGLYDMYGNVWEWVQDNVYSYEETPTDGSAWEEEIIWNRNSYPFHVFRGGGWSSGEDQCRSAARNWGFGDQDGTRYVGFRLAMDK